MNDHASLWRAVAAQTRTELLLTLRRGENILITVIIPVILLVFFAALGVPCVAPYTCTRVAKHGPYTSPGGGVETSVHCAGSYRKTCGNMICMPELTPDRLWPRLSEVLDSWRHNSRSA